MPQNQSPHLIEDADGAPYPGGIQAIAHERARQITEKGHTPEHDAQHSVEELAQAAEAYLLAAYDHPSAASFWPWADGFRPTDQLTNLTRAGALVAAAIDRLNTER